MLRDLKPLMTPGMITDDVSNPSASVAVPYNQTLYVR